MRRCRLFLVLLFPWLITGCSHLAASSPPPLATITPKAIQPTQSSVTPTSRREPTATATAVPTSIAELPTATPDIIGTVTALRQPRIYAAYPSSDGQWRMKVVIFDCVPVGETDEAAYEQLILIRARDGVEQIVDTQLIYCGGLGAYGFKGLFWSPNSRYFYYTSAREGSPDGLCSYWEPPIFSFEVTTGNKEAIGMGPRSPDGKKIAAWYGDGEIVVWDIDAGEVGHVSIAAAGNIAGPIVWSPDSRALIYLQTTTYCPPRGKSYVGRIDLPDLQHTPVIESEALSFEDARWDTPNRIRLFDESGREWLYDFATKELKPQ